MLCDGADGRGGLDCAADDDQRAFGTGHEGGGLDNGGGLRAEFGGEGPWGEGAGAHFGHDHVKWDLDMDRAGRRLPKTAKAQARMPGSCEDARELCGVQKRVVEGGDAGDEVLLRAQLMQPALLHAQLVAGVFRLWAGWAGASLWRARQSAACRYRRAVG